MKNIGLVITALLFGSLVFAQPPAGEVKKGDTYGEKFSTDSAITLEELAVKLEKNITVDATITGKVVGVCAKKGCWLTMEMPDKSLMQIQFKDYAFFVPTALTGKMVALQGLARKKIVSVNELKHFAEDAKKPKADIDAITQPVKQVKFEATGVVVI